VPHTIGTTARIAQVDYLEDGRMNIFTHGVQRFRIVALAHERAYLLGDVEAIEQAPSTDEARALMPRAQELFNEYFRTYLALGNQWTRGITLPDDPGEAADYIAARVDTSAEIKQEWLEELSPEVRLTKQLELMAQLVPEMKVRLGALLQQKTTGFGVLN
jgi:ATP-dependent Lon protease